MPMGHNLYLLIKRDCENHPYGHIFHLPENLYKAIKMLTSDADLEHSKGSTAIQILSVI